MSSPQDHDSDDHIPSSSPIGDEVSSPIGFKTSHADDDNDVENISPNSSIQLPIQNDQSPVIHALRRLNSLLKTLQEYGALDQSDQPDQLDQPAFHLSWDQFNILLDILDRNTYRAERESEDLQQNDKSTAQREELEQAIIQQAFGTSESTSSDQLLAGCTRRCARILDCIPWDYENQCLTFRVTSEIHNHAANNIRDYILAKFDKALKETNIPRCIAQGDRTLTYKSSTHINKSEPDLNFWLAPPFDASAYDDESDEGNDGRGSPPTQSHSAHHCIEPVDQYPGLIVEVAWSHKTPPAQCKGYIRRSNGMMRCVILLTADYVRPVDQPTTPYLPEVTLDAWRCDPSGVHHFIRNEVIWKYTPAGQQQQQQQADDTIYTLGTSSLAAPSTPIGIKKPDGTIELTLGDLSSTLDATHRENGPNIVIQWRALRKIFCNAYEGYRVKPTANRKANSNVEEPGASRTTPSRQMRNLTT